MMGKTWHGLSDAAGKPMTALTEVSTFIDRGLHAIGGVAVYVHRESLGLIPMVHRESSGVNDSPSPSPRSGRRACAIQ